MPARLAAARAVVIIVAAAASTASSPSAPTATVQLLGATLHPAAPDGLNWDGVGSATNDDINKLEELLAAGSGNPYAPVALLLSDIVADPDAFGTASWAFGGEVDEELVTELPTADDTLEPAWEEVVWQGIALDENTEFILDLIDEDLEEHDQIGTVRLSGDKLLAATEEEHRRHIQVDEQDSRRILFVEVLVQMD